MNKILKLLGFLVLLVLSFQGFSQSVSIDLKQHNSVKAMSGTQLIGVLKFIQSSGSKYTLMELDFGEDVETVKIELIKKRKSVFNYDLDIKNRGPRSFSNIPSTSKVSFEIPVGMFPSWLRVVNILPCIEASLNSDGDWFVSFDCEGIANDGYVDIEYFQDSVQTFNVSQIKITPVRKSKTNFQNIVISKY